MVFEEITIREVQETDVEALFIMLVDLVKYEGIFDRFQLTPERLRNELFGEKRDWHGLVSVIPGGELAGFCLYSYANTNRAFNLTPLIQIDDLYVAKKYRRLGIGNKLLQAIAEIAKSQDIARISVYCVKDNEQGQRFYQKLGAEKLDYLDIYKMSVARMLSNSNRIPETIFNEAVEIREPGQAIAAYLKHEQH